MGGAGGELRHDLRGGQEQHLDVRHARERAAVVARAARLALSTRPARAKKAAAFSCSRPFDGTARISGPSLMHGSPAAMRSSQNEQPTAGDGWGAPRCCSSRS